MTQTTLESRSFILGISWNNIKHDLFTLFLNRIATTVSDPKNRKVWIFESFNDNCLDISKYPIVVIESPKVPTNNLTFGKKKISGSVEVYVFTNTKEQSDQISSQIINTLCNSRSHFRKYGVSEIDLIEEDPSFEKLNKEDGRHVMMLVFTFTLYKRMSW
jgi:hypothetical protein